MNLNSKYMKQIGNLNHISAGQAHSIAQQLKVDLENVDRQYQAVLIELESHPESTQARGFIFLDSNERFNDGVCVITSTVKNREELDDNFAIINTRNTTYLVVKLETA